MISIGIRGQNDHGSDGHRRPPVKVARVSPTDTVGAELAMPMTMSRVAPMAFGSSRAGGP